jgi:hypothetical protein
VNEENSLPDSPFPEKVFYEILEDLKEYLDILTLVGGWVPFVYARHVWHLTISNLVTTADIDFGVSGKPSLTLGRTVYETLSSLDYRERHVRIGRLWPVVLYRGGKIPVEFIADPRSDLKAIADTLGPQIHLNRIEGFDFLLASRMVVRMKIKAGVHTIFCPEPAAFLYDKLRTFSSRENELKKAKDLFYAYFVLRFSPDLPEIYRQIRLYHKQGIFSHIESELRSFFGTLTSQGPLWIEKENGPDELIESVRRDAYTRFNELRRNAFGRSADPKGA